MQTALTCCNVFAWVSIECPKVCVTNFQQDFLKIVKIDRLKRRQAPMSHIAYDCIQSCLLLSALYCIQ